MHVPLQPGQAAESKHRPVTFRIAPRASPGAPLGPGLLTALEVRSSSDKSFIATGWTQVVGGVQRRRVSIGIGTHYGQVFAGVIEGGGLLEFTVIGDAVNTAHWIEELTKTTHHSLLVSAELLEATKSPYLDYHAPPPQMVRGRREALRLFAPVWSNCPPKLAFSPWAALLLSSEGPTPPAPPTCPIRRGKGVFDDP
jgi:Adenylate and Guanylate cyclase catalytic domain